MEKTPLSMRKQIVLIGETNSGKSTLFNAILNREDAIVSAEKGTTTDPLIKAMELIPYGPVAVVDTAGLGDDTVLGSQRMKKTEEKLRSADLVICVYDITNPKEIKIDLKDKAYLDVYTKCDLLSNEELETQKKNSKGVFVSGFSKDGIDELKKRIIQKLSMQERDDESLLKGLLPKGATVVLVTPIDSAAPKGRLILPQVQLIRDCLDNDMKAYVTKENTLKDALNELKKVDLVVTDSQAFKIVDEIVPKEIPLTSFSMLLARQKGNFKQYLDGAEHLLSLTSKSKVLVMEGCSHNSTHEDIGRVKIPALIKKATGADCEFVYVTGYQFPENVEKFDLALSCGMCMINKQEVKSRLEILKNAGIPVVNYGIAIACLSGILDRAKEIFGK